MAEKKDKTSVEVDAGVSNRQNFEYATFYFESGGLATLHWWRAENQFPNYFDEAININYKGIRKGC